MMLRDRKPFHFIKLRKIWYALSILLLLPGIISLCTQGLNLGIDFQGGSLLNLRFNQPTTVEQVRGVVADFGLEGATIQRSEETLFLIRTKELSEEESAAIVEALDQELGGVTVDSNDRVGPTIGRELVRNSLLALVIASILMIIYIAWRFEFKQGVAAVIGILFGAVVTTGVFSIFQIEIDSKFVAAILTILGYSINDTIVIFDRVRENMLYRKKGEALEDVINNSLWQTMARSINTTLAVVFILVALLVLGGATIRDMTLALLIGVAIAPYSSICNATPLWYDLKKSEERLKPNTAKVSEAKA